MAAAAALPAREVAITFDVEWAPDFVLYEVGRLLLDAGVPATWFVTHASPAVDWLAAQAPLFELGIHPNFLPGSTHGDTVDQVLERCMDLVPGARCSRSHCLFQSTSILAQLVRDTPVRTDCSLFLPHASGVEVMTQGFEVGSLRRVPHIWEDDAESFQPVPRWSLEGLMRPCRHGPLVLDFHPLLVCLNDADLSIYRGLRQHFQPMQSAPEARVRSVAADPTRPGPRAMLASAIDYARRQGTGRTVSALSGA